jgi:competence protein ComEA
MKLLLLAFCALMLSIGSAFAAVNVNTASEDELQSIRGIGPTIAQRIVEERRKGPFKNLDDLQARVKGVGEASVRKFAAAGLTVGGAGRGARDAAPADPSSTVRSEAKAGAKTDAKTDAKVAAGADAKAVAKIDTKAHAKAAPKAEPGRDARPADLRK